MARSSRVAEIFTELAGALVGPFDRSTYMARLVSRVDDLLPARAIGLLVADGGGQLRSVAVKSPANELEALQVESQEGPCFDCYRSGRPILHVDLGSGTRWPEVAGRATALGFGTVDAFPLRFRDEVVGAMSLFAVGTAWLSEEETRLAQALSDLAAVAVAHQRVQEQSEQLTGQLQAALDSRVVIEQAKGVVAERRGTSVDEAFTWLRDRARRTQTRLYDLAALVVSDPESIDRV